MTSSGLCFFLFMAVSSGSRRGFPSSVTGGRRLTQALAQFSGARPGGHEEKVWSDPARRDERPTRSESLVRKVERRMPGSACRTASSALRRLVRRQMSEELREQERFEVRRRSRVALCSDTAGTVSLGRHMSGPGALPQIAQQIPHPGMRHRRPAASAEGTWCGQASR